MVSIINKDEFKTLMSETNDLHKTRENQLSDINEIIVHIIYLNIFLYCLTNFEKI